MRNRLWALCAIFGIGVAINPAVLHGAGRGDPPKLTEIEEVVMYGIDADTYELLRYTFGADQYISLGVVMDSNQDVITDIEGLSLIPHGPHKGLYGTANFHNARPSRLVRINPLDATATVCPSDIGYDNVEGLVAVKDPDTYEWSLLAAARQPQTSLITIDPATGAGSLVMETANHYEGLALAPDGTLYGTVDEPTGLWTIDVEAGSETLVGTIDNYTEVEALEYAFGDGEERIKIPLTGADVVPDSWTMAGVLFGFADDQDALLIINAATGKAVEWECSFKTIDCEGLVFTTNLRDPFGPIVASPCD